MALDETAHYRAVASALVDNLLAKAIVKASQELAFTHSVASVSHRKSSLETSTMSNGVTITGPPSHQNYTGHDEIWEDALCQNDQAHERPQSPHKQPASEESNKQHQPAPLACVEMAPTTPKLNSKPKPLPTLQLNRGMSFLDQETPEIQIDLAGPRTPSPVDEVSFELPKPELRLYKFKVADDSMCNLAENESGDTQNSPMTPTEMKQSGLRRVELNTDEVDVATTPESEIDIVHAQEISKHIVADIIHQAVEILNHQKHDPNNNGVKCKQPQSIKRDGESMSKISAHSNGRTSTTGPAEEQCAWIGRFCHAVTSLAHSMCFCATDSKDTPIPKPTFV